MYYTLGQRQGLGIGGPKSGDGEPWYVAAKDLANNILTVVQGHDHPLLQSDSLQASNMHWIAGQEPRTHWVYAAKTRYRQPDAPCENDSIAGDRCEIRFGEAQWAVTPGQSVVVYESNVCLGGGIIL
jgi:tRNA-specific 2-thiouridylase